MMKHKIYTIKTESRFGRQSESVPNKAYNFSEPVVCWILSSAEVMMINLEWPARGRAAIQTAEPLWPRPPPPPSSSLNPPIPSRLLQFNQEALYNCDLIHKSILSWTLPQSGCLYMLDFWLGSLIIIIIIIFLFNEIKKGMISLSFWLHTIGNSWRQGLKKVTKGAEVTSRRKRLSESIKKR